jgi:hypothetical protein
MLSSKSHTLRHFAQRVAQLLHRPMVAVSPWATLQPPEGLQQVLWVAFEPEGPDGLHPLLCGGDARWQADILYLHPSMPSHSGN